MSKAIVPADYLKKKGGNKGKKSKSKPAPINSINFEEFGPNLEKYLKKNRRIDIRKLKKEQPKKTNRTTNNSSSLSKAIVPADYFRNISRSTNNDDYIFNSNTGNVGFLRQRCAIKPKKDIDTNIVLPTSHSLNLNRHKRRAKKRKNTTRTTTSKKAKKLKKEIDEYLNDLD